MEEEEHFHFQSSAFNAYICVYMFHQTKRAQAEWFSQKYQKHFIEMLNDFPDCFFKNAKSIQN